jgi:hypothetical protein
LSTTESQIAAACAQRGPLPSSAVSLIEEAITATGVDTAQQRVETERHA